MTTFATPQAESRRDALVERLFAATLSAFDLYAVYLGDRLGLYRELADHGRLTAPELARAAAIDERYATEWLEQQAVTGILEVDDAGAAADERAYSLPDGHDEALLDETSLAYAATFARFVVAVGRPLPELRAAFRTGAGIPYADYGEDLCGAQAAFTRPLFDHLLGSEWLPAVADVHARLLADPPARVADLACGAGHSTIAIARAYPRALVHGVDLDPASIDLARRNLALSGVEDRVELHLGDAADSVLGGRFDLVTIFEALHDMSHPVEVLAAARRLLADGGSVFVADERVAETFTAPGDDVERLYYGFSLTHCLPVGLVDAPAAGTGAVMREATVRRYAAEAGFASVEVLPIENDFWRFYRLRG
jgi:2-polyprenyl-3-methyl-5-hydroxy-6-metoxy-1,4-benzoquinol methylase